jgi:hypothetical protein
MYVLAAVKRMVGAISKAAPMTRTLFGRQGPRGSLSLAFNLAAVSSGHVR